MSLGILIWFMIVLGIPSLFVICWAIETKILRPRRIEKLLRIRDLSIDEMIQIINPRGRDSAIREYMYHRKYRYSFLVENSDMPLMMSWCYVRHTSFSEFGCKMHIRRYATWEEFDPDFKPAVTWFFDNPDIAMEFKLTYDIVE